MARYRGPFSNHFDGTKFFYPGFANAKNWLDILRWQIGSEKQEWPDWVDDVAPVVPLPLPENLTARLTFVNHATFLIQTHQGNFVTDPVWSKRASPFQWLGPARVRAPGIQFESLPKIDFALISHNHYDHMDEETIKRLKAAHDPIFFAGLGDGPYLKKYGVTKIQEMDWEQTVIQGPVKITYEKSAHWSQRSLNDTNESLWGSYILELPAIPSTTNRPHSSESRKIYFAGDTAYHSHFREMAEKYGPMDVSLLPIGAYEPRWFMKGSHMNPDEAVQAHHDLQSQISIAMHFGTFQLTDEGLEAPTQAIERHYAKTPELRSRFLIQKFGQSFDLV